MSVDLAPHQQKAVSELHNGSILAGGVGVGKSRTALSYFYTKVCGGNYEDMQVTSPRDIYVITTPKKRNTLDWEAEAVKFGISRLRETSVFGIQLTVDSWNNLWKYVDVKDAFFIFDEQRVVGSGAWTKAFIKIARENQWILLSATPGDTWMDYIPVFVANGYYKNRSEFIARHVIYKTFHKFPKVDRYIDVNRLVKIRNAVLVTMPYQKHTVRHMRDVLVDYDQELMQKVMKQRWHVYDSRPLRDVSELFGVMRKVANSNASRLQEVSKLMTLHPRLIVFYTFDYELEILRTLASTPHPGTELKETHDLAEELTPKSVSLQDASQSHVSEDPLKGTIWESGYDEELELRVAREGNSEWKSSKPARTTLSPQLSDSTSSSTSSSDVLVVESNSPQRILQGGTTTTTASMESGSTFQVAEWNGHNHDEIPNTERWLYLVQYTAGSEGWNCVETDAICFYSQTYSYKMFYQAQGRIDRLDTPFKDLWYYNLVSKAPIDLAIKKCLKEKRSFNEASFSVNI